MSRKNQYSNNIPAHLEDETIIAFLDGELSVEEKLQASRHLEKCWSCRGNLKIVQDSIDNFMNRRQEILIPTTLPPSEPALEIFRERLENYQLQTRRAPVFSFSSLRSKIKLSGLLSTFSALKISNNPISLRIGIAALVVFLIAALLINQSTVQIVSASQLLEKSVAAQTEKIGATNQAVVYQKLQIKRKNAPAADLEIWRDTTRPRVRQLINHSTAVNKTENKLPAVLGDLPEILRSNNLNPLPPLSPVTFQKWRASLAEKTDEVSGNQDGSGVKFLSLRTIDNSIATPGKIIESALTPPLKMQKPKLPRRIRRKLPQSPIWKSKFRVF